MGRKRDDLAATVRSICSIQHHLAAQREQYALGRVERGEMDARNPCGIPWAEYNRGKKEAYHRIASDVGEHIGPPPPIPYAAPGGHEDFWKTHDPDDWRQWRDIPEEFARCEWERFAGCWRPVGRDPKDVPKDVPRGR